MIVEEQQNQCCPRNEQILIVKAQFSSAVKVATKWLKPTWKSSVATQELVSIIHH